jgi:hypothetical protein
MEKLNSVIKLQREYELWEYLLVVHPSKELNDKVFLEKESFFGNYAHRLAIKTKPHITVANFLAKEGMEETLGRWIQNICNLQNSFTVTFK